MHYGDEVRALTTAAVVKVDGQDCGNKIIFAKESKPRGRNVVVKKGVSVSDSSIRPFVFSQCQYHGMSSFLLNSFKPLHYIINSVGQRTKRFQDSPGELVK